MVEPRAPVPEHVPATLVRDIDPHAPPGTEGGTRSDVTSSDVHAVWTRVQDSLPPLFWTPRHGRHWGATRRAEIERMLLDPAIFSSAQPFIPRVVRASPISS